MCLKDGFSCRYRFNVHTSADSRLLILHPLMMEVEQLVATKHFTESVSDPFLILDASEFLTSRKCRKSALDDIQNSITRDAREGFRIQLARRGKPLRIQFQVIFLCEHRGDLQTLFG